MMHAHHDLSFEEIRRTNKSESDRTYWWCICGLYSGSTPTLSRTEGVEGFMEHLNDVQEGHASVVAEVADRLQGES